MVPPAWTFCAQKRKEESNEKDNGFVLYNDGLYGSTPPGNIAIADLRNHTLVFQTRFRRGFMSLPKTISRNVRAIVPEIAQFIFMRFVRFVV